MVYSEGTETAGMLIVMCICMSVMSVIITYSPI